MTREVRWFFDADSEEARALESWFQACAPLPQDSSVRPPVWQDRAGHEPDIYLLLPGHNDMGIKWREGLLQIKGRIEAAAITSEFGPHLGYVERWSKWSYAGLPPPYRDLFRRDSDTGLGCVAVEKRRALRLAEFDLAAKSAREVGADSCVDRGLVIELAAVGVRQHRYFTLCFEAFPDDGAVKLLFDSIVETFLADLSEVRLDAEHSLSYPAWLARHSA